MTEFIDSEKLWKLIFGSSPLEDDVSRWQQQGFVLTSNFVLEQTHGGPCGILATVQAFMLIDLIFKSNNPVRNFNELMKRDHALVTQSLVRALLAILNRAGRENHPQTQINLIQWNEEKCKFFSSPLKDPSELISFTLLDFLATLIVYRGIETTKSDMDDISNPLISRFGHCSQEILNLVLFGRATSNVFDGEENLGEGMSLRGVAQDAQISVGLLSELESLRYVTVGSKLKNPEFPFWLIGSTNHYTLLFSFNKVRSETVDPYIAAFQAYAFDEGIATGDSVEKISADLKLASEEKISLKSMVKEDVLLLSDYQEWIRSIRGGSGHPDSPRKTNCEFVFVDGQHPVSVLAVTLSDSELPVPEGVADYGDNLRAIVRTKWPQYRNVRALKLV